LAVLFCNPKGLWHFLFYYCDSLAKGDLTGEIFNQISRRRGSHDGDIRRECYSIKNTKLRKEREEERESGALSQL
jgi:hypothetical protein